MTAPLRAGFVGAGAIHFGGAEGPWDHSVRLEKCGGIQFVGIADPLVEKVKSVLDAKLASEHGDMYKDCKIYASHEQMLAEANLDVVFIGTPPNYRGSSGRPMELDFVKAGVHCFIEKPVSITPSDNFQPYVDAITAAQKEKGVVVSVGYMFRYHAAVKKMQEIIASHGGKVMAVNARYYLAYSCLDHAYWWDASKSGGPIIEQATHFCDLARYLGGDIQEGSVKAICLRDTDEGGAGKLAKVPENCEVGLAPENRAPRSSLAIWKYENGGVGTLSHVVALHGENYEATLDVLMDGIRMHLYEPYRKECVLKVRDGRTGKETDTVYDFGDDDPYETELKAFLEAVRSGDHSTIASPYSDAAKTYKFTWDFRNAASS